METATAEQSPAVSAQLTYDNEQQEAIARCCDPSVRFWPVTGAAGTGKTTIIREVYRHYQSLGIPVVLAAPTGKAARRIWEATGIEAMTLHRLLEYTHPGDRDPKTGKCYGVSFPKRSSDYRLDQRVVIVDEYTMVGHELHNNLIKAVPAGGLVRVFGDVNQLQPIESADIYKRMSSPFQAALNKFKGTRLVTNHRQGAGSGIIVNARLILDRRMPVRRDDFNVIMTDAPVKEVERVVFTGMDVGLDWSSVDNQFITPANKSWIGVHAINGLLARIFYPDAVRNGYRVDRHPWMKDMPMYLLPGMKVINTNNNYDIELFNGEGGIVKEITGAGEIVIDDGTREIVVPPWQEYEKHAGYDDKGNAKTKIVGFNPQMDLWLGYCISTHKAQGSEYDNVTYLLNKSVSMLCCRPNLYTGVTRARKHVNLITDQRTLYTSVVNEQSLMDKKKKVEG